MRRYEITWEHFQNLSRGRERVKAHNVDSAVDKFHKSFQDPNFCIVNIKEV